MFRQAMALWALPMLVVFAFSCAALAPPSVPVALAQDSLGDSTSLGQAPEDVAFYSALFNGRKVYDAIAGSNAVQRVWELPSTQDAFQEIYGELDGEGLLDWIEEAENQQLLTLLADLGSHEIYVCGDEGLADVTDLYTECAVESIKVNFELMMMGYYGDDEAMLTKATLDVLKRRLEDDELVLPNIVFGFKLTEEEAAEAQLARLEELLLMLIGEMGPDLPDLEGRLERVTVGDSELLTFRLDGSLAPWEEIGYLLESIECDLDDYEDLIEELGEQELLISLGVKDGYAVLSIGPDHDFLAALGEGPALWDHEYMAPLRDAELSVEEIFAVSYMSDSMAARMDAAGRTVQMYVDMFESMASANGRGGSAEDFLDDLPELRRDLASLLPERRAMLSYSYFTERGVEGYLYDRSLDLPLDSTQTLPILDHGGEPLLMVAGRQPYSTHAYEIGAKWAGKIYGYWESEMRAWGGQERAQMIDNMREEGEPLVEELHNIVLTMVLPSMADGQRAIVLDGDITSESWFQYMDPPEEALPMVEVGVVIGMSDSDMLVEGFTSGREVVNDLIEAVNDATNDEAFPGAFLPSPLTTEVEGGVMYSYPWQEMDFHEKMNPNAVVSEDWLVLSLSPEHSQRMLSESELPETPPLARRDEPLAGVVFIDVAGSVDAIEPWVDYFIAGNDTYGQRVYGSDVWIEDEVTIEAWDDGEGQDPFDEDPFREEEGEADPFDEDPFGEEAEEAETEPEFDGDPFDGEDPFEDREPHRFHDPYGGEYGPYGYEEEYYQPRHRRQWAPGEAEATAEATLNLIRSVRTFSAAMYREDEVMVTHFEWHLADAGTPSSESDRDSGGEE